MADIQVVNTDANLSGNTLITEENAYTITGLHTYSRSTSAPFAVNSGAAVVANLDADKLDGIEATGFVKADGTVALSANWDSGGYEIRANTFESDVATGTIPLVIASTTKCTNLNADKLDDQEGTYYLDPGNLSSAVAVNKGGTGATTLTDGGVLLGSGTSAITATAVLGDGVILIGDASGDPTTLDVGSSTAITTLGTVSAGTWQGDEVVVAYGGTGRASLTDGGILIGKGTAAINQMAVLADGEMVVGDGTTDPVAEGGATLRTSVGVGTGDSPQFTGLTVSGTGASALDVGGGLNIGTGNVSLVGTDGKLEGPLSSTIIDDLSGANLTTLNASNISSGTLAAARLPAKVTVTSSDADALDVTGGLTIGSGDVALVGVDGKLSGPLSTTIIDDLSGANLTTLNASNLSSGTVATARLGSGTASSSTFLRGDGAWEAAGGAHDENCKVFNNADQSIANATAVALAWNSEQFDTDTMHDTSTNNSRITFTTAGTYIITANLLVDMAGGATTNSWTLWLKVNGTEISRVQWANITASEDRSVLITDAYVASADDYVEVVVYNNSGVTGTVRGLVSSIPASYCVAWRIN